MKLRFLILFIFVLYFSSVQAQEYNFNGINCAIEPNYYGIYIAPSFTRTLKRHTFSLGPAFNALPYYLIVHKKPTFYYPTKQRFIGGRISYENLFFSSRRKKMINLFFNLNLTYHHIVFSDYENYSTKEIDPFFVSRAQFLGFYFGLGNYIYYRSGLYLNPSIVWGFPIYEKLGDPPSFSIPDRGYLSNAMVLKFGIGYFFLR